MWFHNRNNLDNLQLHPPKNQNKQTNQKNLKIDLYWLANLFSYTDAPGVKLNEGKTKIIYELPNNQVLLQSKDRISANNAEKVNELEGKAAISTATACKVFEYLSKIGK